MVHVALCPANVQEARSPAASPAGRLRAMPQNAQGPGKVCILAFCGALFLHGTKPQSTVVVQQK